MSAPFSTDFTPPDAQITAQFAGGTSANRLGGADPVSERSENRTLPLRVHVRGSSDVQIRSYLAQLRSFISLAGDRDVPTYLEYNTNSDISQQPLWGQGGWYRYEVVHTGGPASLWDKFSNVDLRASGAVVDIQLVVRPFAFGLTQLLANAKGGILSDQWGSPDGTERGVMIPSATPTGGNKMTNPVFGHPTYNNGWTTGANIISSQNMDPRFLLPQTQSSVFLQSYGAADQYYQVINVGGTGTHAFSALMMLPDGGTISNTQAQLYYNTGLSTTYRNLGGGLWLLTATAAGINANTNTGVLVKPGYAAYLLAMQVELASAPSPICWGDLLGCAWSSTAHASASTRTAGVMKIAIDDTVLRAVQGSVAWTWIAPKAHSAYAAASTFFWWDAGTVRAYYDTNTNVAVIGDGSGNSNAALTFAAGEVIVFHATWGANGGLKLYKNGTLLASGASHVASALNASLFIGSSVSPANQIDGTFADLRTYAYELTATEVSNDFTNTSKISGATQDVAQRVGAIPWLYTSAGDGVVGTVDGVVSATATFNWAVACGIAGSVAARTEMRLRHSGYATAFGDIYLARSLWPYFYHGASKQPYYADQGGTADAGASSGDAYSTQSVDSTTPKTWVGVFDNYGYLLAQGREVYIAARLKDAGANLTIRGQLRVLSSNLLLITSDYIPVAADTFMRFFLSKPIILPRLRKIFTDDTVTISSQFEISALRSTGGGSNVSVDFVAILPRPLTVIDYQSGSGETSLEVKDRTAWLLSAASPAFQDFVTYNGDTFELEPGGLNFIQNFQPAPGGVMNVTETLTFNSMRVTPRYALL